MKVASWPVSPGLRMRIGSVLRAIGARQKGVRGGHQQIAGHRADSSNSNQIRKRTRRQPTMGWWMNSRSSVEWVSTS